MNKSNRSFKFLIIILSYLFVITFLLISQPRSGYSATTLNILIDYLLYLPLWIVFIVLIYLSSKAKDTSFIKRLSDPKTIFTLILITLIISFIYNIDFTRTIGCFVSDEEAFSSVKITISTSSLLLLVMGYTLSHKRIGIILLIIEFLFWSFKTLYYDGSLDLFFIGYFTMISWFLKTVLITKLIEERH